MPTIGEVRVHRSSGLIYVYEFNPDTEKLQWLRRDTFVRGQWRNYPWRTAANKDLAPLAWRPKTTKKTTPKTKKTKKPKKQSWWFW